MNPRVARSLLACLVGAASSLRAEPVSETAPYKWNGKLETSLVTDPINWLHDAPDPELGVFDTVFGVLNTNTDLVAQSVIFQQLQNGETAVPLAIGNLSFETGRPAYTFMSGNSMDPHDPDLRLVGDVVVQSGPAVVFDEGLSVVLAPGPHTVKVENEATLDFRGAISEQQSEGDDGATIVKTGSGTLVLGNESGRRSTFTGGLTVSEGTLELGASSWLDGDASAGPAGTGLITLSDGTTLAARGVVSINNPIKINSGTATFGAPDESDSTLTLTGAISGNADLVVAGQVALEGASNFAGDVTVASGGVLTLGTENTLRSDVGINLLANSLLNVRFDQAIERIIGSDVLAEIAIASGAEFTIGLASTEVDSTLIEQESIFHIDVHESGSSITGNILNDGLLHLRSGNVEQPFVIEGAISGTGGVEVGAGVTRLTGNNAYTGGTSIERGATVIAASASGHNPFGDPGASGNAVTVNAGAILALDGATISNQLIVNPTGRLTGNGAIATVNISNGAILAPGGAGANAIGTLTFNHLILGGGGVMEWNLLDLHGEAGSGWDRVIVTAENTLKIPASSENPFLIRVSTIDANGGSRTFTEFIAGQQYQWEIFSTQGINGFNTTDFAFDVDNFLVDGVAVTGADFSIISGVDENANNLFLTFTPVPEPSTYALLGAGLALAAANAWRRCRRR